MILKLRPALSIALVLFMSLGLIAPASARSERAPEVRVIVSFDRPLDVGEENEFHGNVESEGGKVERRFDLIPARVIRVSEDAIPRLKASRRVASVEYDNWMQLVPEPLAAPQVEPWGLDRIDAEVAQAAGYRGAGVKVAILDSGIDDTHPDLHLAGGVSVVSYTTSYRDDYGHGTHVAGIVAGIDNGIGVLGVAPEALLYSVKVLDGNGGGYWSDVIAGLQWSVNNGMQIASMSLGAPQGSFALSQAVNAAYNAGVLLVAAAGNQGKGKVLYPAAYDGVIAISATDRDDSRAYFSNTGKKVELSAPGVSVYSTMPTYPTGMTTASPQYYSENYTYMSGTSMATPYVTGAAALLAGANPGMRGAALRSRLDATAQDLGAASRDSVYGYGLVDAEKAVLGTTSGDNYTGGGRAGLTGITGRVTDASTGAGIAGASIAAVARDGITVATTSGTDGSYTVGNMPMETSYVFICSADGYVPASQTATMPLNNFATVNFRLNR